MFVTLTCTRFERSLSPVLDVLHEWLASWAGIGVIERGMTRQGYDLQLTRYANEGWRATLPARDLAGACHREIPGEKQGPQRRAGESPRWQAGPAPRRVQRHDPHG